MRFAMIAAHRFRCFADVVEDGHHRLFGGRHGNELQGDPVEDAQGAFGPHQEASQVVPGHAFHGAGARLDQFSVRIEELDSHHVVPGHSIAQTAQSPRVFGRVPPEGGNRLAPRVGWIEQVFRLDRGGEFGRHHTGFYDCVKIGLVDFQNLVESGGEDDDALCRGNGSPR